MFTVIVTGSRDYKDWEAVWREMDSLYEEHGSLWVFHGACPTGADHFAEEWVRNWYFPRKVGQKTFPADWDNCAPDCPPGHRRMKKPGDTAHPGRLPDYCPSAGPRRNREMSQAGEEVPGDGRGWK